MKSSYLALALLSLLSLTFFTPVYTACSDTHCTTCSDPAKCTACATGYFVSAEACSACLANCAVCTGNTLDLCTTCNDGFFKDTANAVCAACSAGCKTCSESTAAKCQTCNSGYFFTASAGSVDGTCTACSANCAACTTNAADKCTACNVKYSLETNVCVECGQTGTNCKVCATTAGTCDTCNDGFVVKDKLCAACSAGCKTCSDTTAAKCQTCNSGYFFTASAAGSADGTCTACSSNCAACTAATADKCTTCNVKYSLETTGCVECGKTGTNCKVCATTAGTCDSCNDGFFVKDKLCAACSAGCKTCSDTTATKCDSCIDGYFSDAAKTTCTKCPDTCATCSATNTCLTCKDFFLLDSTKACVKPDCSKETTKKYILINDLSCTDCTGTGFSVYDATYCQNMPVPTITAALQTDGKIKASFTCTQGKNLYWAYGLAGSAFLGLKKTQDLAKTPVDDPLTYLTAGTQTYTAGTPVSFDALPKIKNSGEKYTLFAYCEYLGANSTANTTFTSKNNTDLQTLVISLTTATALTSAQKATTASAIATVLDAKKAVWTDEDKPVYALATKRILADATVNFYILPDYSLATGADPAIATMKTTITGGATAFATSVGTKASLTFTGASAVSYPSSVASPSLAVIYPAITVTSTGFSLTLKQSGAAGTLFWAYKKEAAKANNTQSVITETDFAALTVTSNSTAAVVDTDLAVSVTGLTADTSYTVYYYGQNTGLPKIKTPIYSQIITTTPSSNPTGAGMLKYGFFVLLAILMIILV